MIEVHDRPLITFALFAYNQEKYVREGVEGAFAQIYSPLEIILSDDCSSDGTFEIMKAIAASYRGPHAVRLNRNASNLGIIGHVNHVLARAAGELIVMAAGDDVSFPHRTTALVEAWLAHDRRPDGLCSGFVAVEGARERVVSPPTTFSPLKHCRRGTSGVRGATAARTRRLRESWGPLPSDGLAEDRVLTLRALLSGGMHCVPELLVRYRQSAGPIDGLTVWERRWWIVEREGAFAAVYASDLTGYQARNPASAGIVATLLKELRRTQRRCRAAGRWLAGGAPQRAAYPFLYLFSTSVSGKERFRAQIRPALSMHKGLLEEQFERTHNKTSNHRIFRGAPQHL